MCCLYVLSTKKLRPKCPVKIKRQNEVTAHCFDI